MGKHLGVDIGGTFTDLVLYDSESEQVLAAKGASSAHGPEEGVVRLVADTVADGRERVNLFLHGSTVGLNALLERTGAVVGLLVTKGFRDTLELRRGDRDAMFEMHWHAPEPLVPRWLRLPVSERVDAQGNIVTPIDEDDVVTAAEEFSEQGVESVAVVFLNAYSNSANEVIAERVLRDTGFTGEISLSHRVSGEFREYERTTTTVIDAYVRPQVATYLSRLGRGLRETGIPGELLITRSGGGAMSFDEAASRPFETIMSGPVAGAMGAGAVCRGLEIDEAIAADVGGTSFDTCLISGGHPHVKYEGRVAGLPLQSAWVDVRSIGAGGGSIASVDEGRLLRVGPQSAGARPGPAAYERGGTQPTVTDASLVLGMLGAGDLAGGLTLNSDRAREALTSLGRTLSFTVDEVAEGIVRVLTSSIADAIRSVSVEGGRDPREAALIAFGGAGPLFATPLARELEMRTVVVPSYAGNFSAWGLLRQDVVQSAARTAITGLTDAGLRSAAGAAADLLAGLKRRSSSTELSDTERYEVSLDVRYVGQEYALNVPVPFEVRPPAIAASANDVTEAFVVQYDRTFGHVMQEELEVVAVRASLRTLLPGMPISSASGPDGGSEEEAPEKITHAFSLARRAWLPFRLVHRETLSCGTELSGPCIVLEGTATTYVDVGFALRVHETGALVLSESERTENG